MQEVTAKSIPAQINTTCAPSQLAVGIGAELVEHLLKSALFRHAPQQKRLLRFLADSTLLGGEVHRLKEVTVGIEIFAREASTYDPRTDPIVRVEIGRLRERLDRYFSTEGRAHRFVISLPKGSYRLELEPRHSAEVGSTPLTIAVLPFAQLDDTESSRDLAEGLVDDLICDLARVPTLRAIARQNSLPAPPALAEAVRIGQKLRAAWVIYGSVRMTGQAARVVVMLVSTHDSEVAWSQSFVQLDGNFTPICTSVVENCRSTLGLHQEPSTRTPTPLSAPGLDVETRNLYNRGRVLQLNATHDSLLQALPLLEQAVARAPKFAPAHACLARVHRHMAGLGQSDQRTSLSQARSHALCALQADPNNGEAHAILGSLEVANATDWASAEHLLRRAIALAPSDHFSYSWLAQLMTLRGFRNRAIDLQREACALDPLNLKPRRALAHKLCHALRHEESLHEYDVVLRADPRDAAALAGKSYSYFLQGAYPQALVLMEEAFALQPGVDLIQLGHVCILAHLDRPRACALLDEVLAMFAGRSIHQTVLAQAWLNLGDIDQAFAHIRVAAQSRDGLLISICIDPGFRALWEDPRFMPLIKSFHMPFTDDDFQRLGILDAARKNLTATGADARP
jgi:TolB-like protein/tetratricopeptide (TPR) repeat protein